MISTANLVSMGAAGVLASAVGVRSVFALGGALVIIAGLASAAVFRGVVQVRQAPAQSEEQGLAIESLSSEPAA